MPPVLGLTVALPEADQAVRRVKDDDDQHDAEDELPGVRKMGGRIEADSLEHGGAGKCAEGVGTAARIAMNTNSPDLVQKPNSGVAICWMIATSVPPTPPRKAEIT